MRKYIIFIVFSYFTNTLNAQFCKNDDCYQANECYTSNQVNKQSYKYATVSNIYKSATATDALYITVYSPDVLSKNIKAKPLNKDCKRPFILLMHGGGFRYGCKEFLEPDCIEFAKRGYVAATIDYRKGWLPGDDFPLCKGLCSGYACPAFLLNNCKPGNNDSLNFAVYRTIQDAAAAMRFISHFVDNLNIDENALYIGGYSAGSITALSLAYMNQADINKAMPGVYKMLGGFNSYGNSYKDIYKIAGVFNNWGSIYDTSFINGKADKIPMIAFHGMDDSTVPYAKGTPLNCPNKAFGYTYGSKLIYERLKNKYNDIPVELYACYGSHGIFDKSPAIDERALFRIQKAICFFRRARAGDNTKTYVEINKNEDSISYNDLVSASPIVCDYTGYRATQNQNNIEKIISNKTIERITILPNPVQSRATLHISTRSKKINISILNMQGQVLYKKNAVTENKIDLPVANLNKGVYMVVVNNESFSQVIQFIKTD